MVEKLLIYTDDETLGVIPFPKEGVQANINSYTFTEGRMGSVNISSSIMYERCLDDEWTQREFVEFRGERYWILDTPTSSKSNTDLRYKHELVFKADRTRLDNTYFFDVVSENASDVDQFVSNSTKFTFFGDIHEFATRLKYSLEYSKVGYTVVVDEGITSEAKLMSFEDKYFSEVLQEVFNTYELPYYFVGKTIHIGFTNNALTHVFKYGHDRELLTISKTNANYKIVNRCTGIGSTENIPYYYPNDTRKGAVEAIAGKDNISIKTEDIQVVNNDLYKEKVSLEEKVEFKKTKLPITTQLYINLDEQYPYTQAVETAPTISDGVTDNFKWFKTSYDYYAIIDLSDEATIYLTLKLWANLKYSYIQKGGILFGEKQAERKMDFASFSLYKINDADTDWVLIKADQNSETTVSFNLNEGTNKLKIVGSYSTLVNVSDYYIYGNQRAFLEISRESTAEYNLWSYKDSTVSLSNIGIYITKTPSIGDYFIQKQVEGDYMITSPNLLPPIYRETMGAERFYNAKNNTYINTETGGYYDFENEYTEGNPKEMIVSFDYIKPTIKGVENATGYKIGEIDAVAFDDDDNDEIDPNTNQLEHPYFYIRLRKFDGNYGFNLFDHAIAGNDGTFSITSGNCGACNFKLSVLEDTDNGNQVFKNPVQVDSSGNIVAGNENDKWNEANIQPEQQDTRTNNVWVRVAKDQETFGTVMPSNTRNYKPKAGDSFVITNIDLPLAYIRNAENALKEAIIKYMAANNSEKFNFSITFKRIFFAEYPEMLSQIDSNARLQIEYNDKLYELYISQYTYKVNGTDPLPEITVELSDTITIRKGNVQKSIDAVKQDIMSSIGSIDFLKMGLKYFIRKDVDDFANGNIVFRDGIYVTGKSVEGGTDFILESDEDYIQEANGDFIREGETTIQSRSAVLTLGGLSNVNEVVDSVATEDVILVKKTGSSEWTQERKSVAEGVTEAPNDGVLYGRKNRAWTKVPDIPTKLPNPNAITFTGAVQAIYDGSSAITVNIPTGGGGSITIDDHLDLNSTNAVQNKVITMNINELMNEVFKISFRTFYGGGTFEQGESITPYLYWTIKWKDEMVTPTTATVNDSTTGVSSEKDEYNSPTPITTNKTYRVKCSYNNQTIEKTASYEFSLKKYWGVSSSTELNNYDVISMDSTWASRTMNEVTFDCTGGKYIYYIIPSNIYGDGVDFWVNGFKNNDVVVTDMQVTNSYNVTATYKVMRLNNIQTGILKVEFK